MKTNIVYYNISEKSKHCIFHRFSCVFFLFSKKDILQSAERGLRHPPPPEKLRGRHAYKNFEIKGSDRQRMVVQLRK